MSIVSISETSKAVEAWSNLKGSLMIFGAERTATFTNHKSAVKFKKEFPNWRVTVKYDIELEEEKENS